MSSSSSHGVRRRSTARTGETTGETGETTAETVADPTGLNHTSGIRCAGVWSDQGEWPFGAIKVVAVVAGANDTS
jgi:hypothetical protein